MANITCSLGDGQPVLARGWCGKHYQRWRKYGDPLGGQYERITGVDDRTRFEMRVDRSGGPEACHPWQAGTSEHGYGKLRFSGKMQYAHIVAWEVVHGPVPPGKELDHECHNRAVRSGTCSPGRCEHRRCCNEQHLVPRTRQEHQGGEANGGAKAPRSGEANGRAKLTSAQVLEIRQMVAEGILSDRAIARRYKVGKTAISRIRTGRAWSTLRA